MKKTISPPKRTLRIRIRIKVIIQEHIIRNKKKTRNTNEILIKDMADLGPGSFQKADVISQDNQPRKTQQRV